MSPHREELRKRRILPVISRKGAPDMPDRPGIVGGPRFDGADVDALWEGCDARRLERRS